MAQAISTELATFIQSGLSILVGSRDRRLFPDCLRAVGARVERGRREVTIFVPTATGAPAVANFAENGRVAICFSRIEDHRSIQVKGRVVSVAPASEADRAVIERYRGEFVRNLAFIGMPPRLTLRLNAWPCHAVRLRVESLFLQTPGPGAGAPLAAPPGDPEIAAK
jgi:hypothetical protein